MVIDQRNHCNPCYGLTPSTSNVGLEAAPWRAVYLRSRYEAVSARFLTEKGYEVFLPTCKSRRQRSDRCVTLELPLFPGYLFCRCAEPHISSVLNTCGVLRVLGTRESPAVVNEEEIRHLATVTRAKLDVQPCAFITSGQTSRAGTAETPNACGRIIWVRGSARMCRHMLLRLARVTFVAFRRLT